MNEYINHPNQMNIEYGLMHEMSHARYLVDLYGFDVNAPARRLVSAVAADGNRLDLDRDVASDGDFPVPGFYALDGELVGCASKSGSALTACVRGAEGTRAVSHDAGALVHVAVVRLQDGRGKLVQGSPVLPLVGGGDHLYVNRYPDDLMVAGRRYFQHSAYAWNRIAGRRPVCGNFNSPCNAGEYLQDLPSRYIVDVRDAQGRPLVGARVAWYRAQPLELWYGKSFTEPPNGLATTDGGGRADLGAGLFTVDNKVVHGFGHSTGVILIKISLGGATDFQFLEVTEANEAYWAGQRESAVFIIRTRLSTPEGGTPGLSTPTHTPSPTEGAPCQREELLAPFAGGPRAVTSLESYSGSINVVVGGVGQAAGQSLSDAFYIFTDDEGRPATPRHPTGLFNQVLTVNGEAVDAVLQGSIPAYSPDHLYSFAIAAPGGPLEFGVGDVVTHDNSGSYAIKLIRPCGSPTPSPSSTPLRTPYGPTTPPGGPFRAHLPIAHRQ